MLPWLQGREKAVPFPEPGKWLSRIIISMSDFPKNWGLGIAQKSYRVQTSKLTGQRLTAHVDLAKV
jgi:hypothetical protein